MASEQGELEVARLLLSAGAKLAASGGRPLLISASERGDLRTVKLLLESDADVGATDFEDNTALHWACAEGHLEVAQLLCCHGASRAAVASDGHTPEDDARGMGPDTQGPHTVHSPHRAPPSFGVHC